MSKHDLGILDMLRKITLIMSVMLMSGNFLNPAYGDTEKTQAEKANIQNSNTEISKILKNPSINFGNFYIGFGLGGTFSKNSGNVHSKNTLTDPTISPYPIYFNFDLHFKRNTSYFSVPILIGFGDVLNDSVYLGVEGIMDWNLNKKKIVKTKVSNANAKTNNQNLEIEDPAMLKECRGRQGICSSSLGIRFGKILNNEYLFYGKISASHSSYRLYLENDGNSAKKIAPAFAIGIEKMLNDKFSARLEVEYKVRSMERENNLEHEGNMIYESSGKYKYNQNLTFRMMIVYNI